MSVKKETKSGTLKAIEEALESRGRCLMTTNHGGYLAQTQGITICLYELKTYHQFSLGHRFISAEHLLAYLYAVGTFVLGVR